MNPADQARAWIDTAIMRAARVAARTMAARVPRKTGELRSSFVWTPTGEALSLSDHAAFVQWGTRRVRGVHFAERGARAGAHVLMVSLARGA